jgi:hypothetical protein
LRENIRNTSIEKLRFRKYSTNKYFSIYRANRKRKYINSCVESFAFFDKILNKNNIDFGVKKVLA